MIVRDQYSAENDLTLFHGDCLHLLRSIPDGSAQLVFTSPPYNIGKEYEERLSIEVYLEQQAIIIPECTRILAPGGSICWQVGNHVTNQGEIIPLDMLLYSIFSDLGSTHQLRLRNRVIWSFGHGLHCKKRLSPRYETILWYTRGDSYRFDLDPIRVPQKYPGKKAYKGPKKGTLSCNPLGKNPSDVWDLPNVKHNHVEKVEHPCQFPIELPERFILACTSRGDLVVDPFLGVGTTLAAAALHNRKGAGSDIHKNYLILARERVEAATQGTLKRRAFSEASV